CISIMWVISFFIFSSRRRHTRFSRDWSSDVCSSDLDVAVYHYNKSEQGQRFAENIQNVFKQNSVSNRSYKNVDLIFEDKNSLYRSEERRVGKECNARWLDYQ